jgi:Cytochrome c554 and c-prime
MVRASAASSIFFLSVCYLVLRIPARDNWIAYAQTSPEKVGEVQVRRQDYLGDEACMPCHREQALPYNQTSHHLTSQLPSTTSILGSFKEGENILMIENPTTTGTDPRLFFKMDIQHGAYYQTAIAEKGSQKLTRSERIDIVTGSGVRGQTYLYWAGNELYELPVSYWSEGNQWINSPGYVDGTANFSRHVDPRCLECHASYIQPLSSDPQTNAFDRNSLVTGISCETCHGPGADHIAREKGSFAGPEKASSNAILNPAQFTRDRQIDLCALCHSGGQRAALKPAFTYLPGQPLDQYLAADPAEITELPDVHGNQVGLLKKSRCYLSSPSMSCSTCHDVHRRERTAAAYSDRCLSCHRWQICGVSHTLGEKITHNCVDCHMPMQQTSAIVSKTANRVLHASIRTHWIKVYPGEKPDGRGQE